MGRRKGLLPYYSIPQDKDTPEIGSIMTLEKAVDYCKAKQKELMEELSVADNYELIATLQYAHGKAKEYIEFLEKLIDETKEL